MSLRSSSPRPRLAPPARGASSGRRALDEVLRAGRAVGPAPVAKPSSLTASLKAMQVTPTGAPCVPLSFDPDYCSGDKFYAFGVAVVSTVIGAAFAQGGVTELAVAPVMAALSQILDSTCRASWYDWFTERAITGGYGGEWFSDTDFCKALVKAQMSAGAMSTYSTKFVTMEPGVLLRNSGVRVHLGAECVAKDMLSVVFAPIIAYANVFGHEIYMERARQNDGVFTPFNDWMGGGGSLFGRTFHTQEIKRSLQTFNEEPNKVMQTLVAGINLQWVRMLAAKTNEMARGVASYMRVNFKQYLKDKTLYETNPIEFSRRILYDIVEDDKDDAPEAEPGSPGPPPPLEPGSPYTPGGTNDGAYTPLAEQDYVPFTERR